MSNKTKLTILELIFLIGSFIVFTIDMLTDSIFTRPEITFYLLFLTVLCNFISRIISDEGSGER